MRADDGHGDDPTTVALPHDVLRVVLLAFQQRLAHTRPDLVVRWPPGGGDHNLCIPLL